MSERHMVRWPDHWAPQSLLVEVFNVALNSAEAAPLLAGMQGEGQVVKVCVTVYMCAARLCIIMAQSALVYSDMSNVWLLAHRETSDYSTGLQLVIFFATLHWHAMTDINNSSMPAFTHVQLYSVARMLCRLSAFRTASFISTTVAISLKCKSAGHTFLFWMWRKACGMGQRPLTHH